MKINHLFFIALFSFNSLASNESSVIKDGVKSITSSITSSSKDALSGIQEGLNEGRASGSSVDGAIIIYDKENLAKNLDIKVLECKSLGENKYLITTAIKNNSDSAIRLTNLNDRNNIFILDSDGFTAYMRGIQNDITIPQKSASKARFEFIDSESKPKTLRLYGYDIDIPEK
ncbi:TPA: hypothetical protein U2I51_004224 [Providencia rettgeri]|nr:hypothetical protein [Providencia rettgeri]